MRRQPSMSTVGPPPSDNVFTTAQHDASPSTRRSWMLAVAIRLVVLSAAVDIGEFKGFDRP
jgi:hypothetical protein